MRIPNVEERHMDRALETVLSIPDSPSLKEVIKKDNPGLVRALSEQVDVLVRAEESEEYIQAFITGFYSCYFLIKEAMTDEGLN
jgi:hypothetical protein